MQQTIPLKNSDEYGLYISEEMDNQVSKLLALEELNREIKGEVFFTKDRYRYYLDHFKQLELNAVSLESYKPSEFSLEENQKAKQYLVMESLSSSIRKIFKKIKELALRFYEWLCNKIDDFFFYFNKVEKLLKHCEELFKIFPTSYVFTENPRTEPNVSSLCFYNNLYHTPLGTIMDLENRYKELMRTFRSRMPAVFEVCKRANSDPYKALTDSGNINVWKAILISSLYPIDPNVKLKQDVVVVDGKETTVPRAHLYIGNESTYISYVVSRTYPGDRLIVSYVPQALSRQYVATRGIIADKDTYNPYDINDPEKQYVFLNELSQIRFEFQNLRPQFNEYDRTVKGFPQKDAKEAYEILVRLFKEIKKDRTIFREMKLEARKLMPRFEDDSNDDALQEKINTDSDVDFFRVAIMFRQITLKLLKTIDTPYATAAKYVLRSTGIMTRYLYEELLEQKKLYSNIIENME